MNIIKLKPVLPADDFRQRSHIYYPSNYELPSCVVCSTQLTDCGLMTNTMKVWRLPIHCKYGNRDDAVWSCWSCQWEEEQSWKSDYLVTVTMVVRVNDMYNEENARSYEEWELSRGSHGRLVSSQVTQIQKETK